MHKMSVFRKIARKHTLRKNDPFIMLGSFDYRLHSVLIVSQISTNNELCNAKHAAVYGRIGTTTVSFGTTASWLVDVLNVVNNIIQHGTIKYVDLINLGAQSLLSTDATLLVQANDFKNLSVTSGGVAQTALQVSVPIGSASTFTPPSNGLGIAAVIIAVLIAAVFAAVLGYFLFFGRISGVFLGIVTLSVTLALERFMAQTAGPECRLGTAGRRCRRRRRGPGRRCAAVGCPWRTRRG